MHVFDWLIALWYLEPAELAIGATHIHIRRILGQDEEPDEEKDVIFDFALSEIGLMEFVVYFKWICRLKWKCRLI